MTYGTKLTLVVLLLSFFLLTGCSNNKDFSYTLYDGYEIRSIAGNSDVVCLKLNDNKYYMIYYVDGEIYGPHDLKSLNETITSLSMTFEEDFITINEIRGKIYE